MKYILLIALIIVSGNVYASVEKFAVADSLSSVYKLDAVDQLLFTSYAEHELKLSPKQIQQLSTQQRVTILGRFFRWIGEFFEPVWGKYREPHRRTQGPYMVFQHDNGDLHAQIV